MPRLSREAEADKKLFVGGLSYETTDTKLKSYFEKYGTLADYVVMRFPDTQRSKGFGFVTFESEDCVEAAMAEAPHTLDGKEVEIKRAKPRDDDDIKKGDDYQYDADGNLSPESKILRKLFVGNLPLEATEDDLRETFEAFGEIDDCVVMKFPDSKRSRGFGFVTFKSSTSVDECQRSRPHKVKGREIDCKRASPKSDQHNPEAHISVKKLFVGRLGETMEDEMLSEYFSAYGNVVKVEQLTWNDTGKKRGFGFVEFDDTDSVDKVVLVGRHLIKGRKLEVKKALSKDELAKSRQRQAAMMGGGDQYGGGMDMRGGGGGRRGDMNMMQMMMSMMMGSGGDGFSGYGGGSQRGFGSGFSRDTMMGGGSGGGGGGYGGPMRSNSSFGSSRGAKPYQKFGRGGGRW